MIRFLSIITILLFNSFLLVAQEGYKNLSDYSSEQIAGITWKSADKQDQTYPKEWNDNSAIYLNWTTLYDLERKGAKIQVTQIIHRKVKVLDDSAIEYFSEIYLPGLKKTYDFRRIKTSSSVRVIKKDGTINNVQAEDYILNEDDNTKKLAVPGLEKEDILEYFIYVVDAYTFASMGTNFDEFGAIVYDNFTIQGDYPILNFKYNIQTAKNFRTSLVTSDDNIKIDTDVDDETMNVYSLTAHKVESVKDQIWTSSLNDLMSIKARVQYTNRRKGILGEPLDINDVEKYTKRIFMGTGLVRTIDNQYKKSIRKRKATNLSGEKALKDYYYFLRHLLYHRRLLAEETNNYNVNHSPSLFYYAMMNKMKQLEINYDVLSISPRASGPIENILDNGELYFILRARIGTGVYFPYLSPFMPYNHIPYGLESSDAYSIKVGQSNTDYAEHVTTPTSTYQENKMLHKSMVKIDTDEDLKLQVSTNVILTGHQYSSYVYELTDWLNPVWDEIEEFETKELALKEKIDYNKEKSFSKTMQERKEYVSEQIEAYAKSHYNSEIEEVKGDAKLVEDRKNPAQIDLSFDCEMNKVIKKVGPNYIVKVGKLVGGQVKIGEEERLFDVHMNYPRMFDYTIEIEVPDGYEVEGLEDINKSINNKAGMFTLSNSLEGNILTIQFQKVYKNNFQSKGQWPLMKEFLEPANVFESKEILLRKK